MKSQQIFDIDSIHGAPHCHASSVIELPNKTLLATWWAGSYEKATDVSIYGSKLELGLENEKWSTPEIIANTLNKFDGTPVPYLHSDNTLFLFYRTMHDGPLIKGGHSVTTIKFQKSNDLGQTWGGWQFLRNRWFRVIRCKPLRLPNGRVILPHHRELFTYQSCFFVNEDPGLNGSWKTVGRLKVKGGCLEPSICLTQDNRIICAMRTYNAKKVYFAESVDGGKSWSKPYPSHIPNPNSQPDLISLQNGHLLLVCNPVEKGRGELSIIRSVDLGRTWDVTGKFVLEREEGERFSYPCIIQTEDGRLHITYTYKRKTIKYWSCKEDEIY
jgi:predicted neuraminidase